MMHTWREKSIRCNHRTETVAWPVLFNTLLRPVVKSTWIKVIRTFRRTTRDDKPICEHPGGIRQWWREENIKLGRKKIPQSFFCLQSRFRIFLVPLAYFETRVNLESFQNFQMQPQATLSTNSSHFTTTLINRPVTMPFRCLENNNLSIRFPISRAMIFGTSSV